MLFSYTLNFFVLISSISVLAAPPPVKPVFDFDRYEKTHTAMIIENKEGLRLARGDWLRRPHPQNLPGLVQEGLSIGDFLSSGDLQWLYCDRKDKTEELAEELRAESSSNEEKKYEKPFVERFDHSGPPSNLKAEVRIQMHTEVTSKIAGVWESVKHPGTYIVIFLHSVWKQYLVQKLGNVEKSWILETEMGRKERGMGLQLDR
ncbi:hypothetical protein AX14_002453 [Amanita brunnescens Koide BX004]|nr:hypothetical protein AX14_002453 [Amanita brunnescens Koide BX004]